MSNVLIFSARMGAGHDGAAHELARRARSKGHEALVVDFLDAFAWPLGELWHWFYATQLRHWPESYERSYQLFYRHRALWAPFVRFERILAGRRSRGWIDRWNPDVIVSTYSFATLVLGCLRQEGLVRVPTVAFLTDFAVHPRTVHPAIDLHLAVHPISAAEAAKYVHGEIAAPGPAVDPSYRNQRVERSIARNALGFGHTERVVLVTAGSWGIGANIPAAVAALARDGRFHVVAASGRDTRLKTTLEQAGCGTVLGWTDAMHLYVAAADVVVENAGGLSSLEAFAAGVPVVSFDPIPGHGRDNVRMMVRAGVTTAPRDNLQLCDAVAQLVTDTPKRQAQR